MCGRFVQATPVAELARMFGFAERPNLAPRYNVAPTQEIAVIRGDEDAGGRQLVPMRWGLVPFWAKDLSIGAKMINARADGITEKPAFREAFRRRRALIPADGFYEWQTLDGKKQPYYIRAANGEPLVFAGLWESWRGPKEEPLEQPLLTATIITTDANEFMRGVHDRMPMILERGDWEAWLDRKSTAPDLASMLKPAAEELLVATPVSTRVNSVRNEGADLIEPLAAEPRLL